MVCGKETFFLCISVPLLSLCFAYVSFQLHTTMHSLPMMINWWKTWIDFVKIKFHSNENIEWHCIQLEVNSIYSSVLNSIQLQKIYSNFIKFELSWREMGYKLVKKVLKIHSWLWLRNKTLKRHTFKKTPFLLFGNWLNKFQFEIFQKIVEIKILLANLVLMNHHHWN